MPAADSEFYSRGKYRLFLDRRGDGSLRTPFYQIGWYDEAAGRNRQRSTGSEDVLAAENELDALYLKRERGLAVCPTCGQARQAGSSHLLTTAIADYLIAREEVPSANALRARLAHVTAYLTQTDRLATVCELVDEDWVEEFRRWAIRVPIRSTGGKERQRSPGTVEASVGALAAAINYAHQRKDTLHKAMFTARGAGEVSRTPGYRADLKTLAAMFRYCVAPAGETAHNTLRRMRMDRAQLHRFLQISVITWARPDAAHEVSTLRTRGQWHSNARALDLNYKGRTQTKKYRPIVPVGARGAALLDGEKGPKGEGGFYITVASVKRAFIAMQVELGLPGDGESGLKLIRRSIAHIARQRLGERDWVEGRIMLGHYRPTTSDKYAPFEIGYLTRALEVTDQIIEEIEVVCAGAFGAPYRPEPAE